MNGWLLIDGSNVVHQDLDLRRLAGSDPELARVGLERLLGGRSQTVVFWDGGPGGEIRSFQRHGLRVDYSGPGEADDRLIAWLRRHGQLRNVVITDDGPLGRRCRSLGARLATARGFAASLRRTGRDAAPERGPPEAHDVDFWLREFRVSPGE